MKASLKVRSEGVSNPCIRIAKFDFNDFLVAGAVPCIEVPGDAIPLGGFLVIESAFDALSTLAVGNAASADVYLAATDATALAKTALDADWLNAGCPIGTKQMIAITPSGPLTQGSGYLVVEYARLGSSYTTQG